MSIYNSLSKTISRNNIQTLTLDIFDTTLLRDIHPEETQFRIVAKKWTNIFRKNISTDITVDELLSIRLYSRNEMWNIGGIYSKNENFQDSAFSLDAYRVYDVNLESWFKQIVEILDIKYNSKLRPKQVSGIVKQMIRDELSTEKQFLKPNVRLIEDIRALKRAYNLKVYFVSDMYLSKKYILELLNHFDVDIFDDGIVSTDVSFTKSNGSLFTYLHMNKPFGDSFDLSSNLHIGDSKNSDYLQPIANGSSAFLYKRINTNDIFNRLSNKIHLRNAVANEKKSLRKKLLTKSNSPANIYYQHGLLFSQAIYTFLLHVGLSANNSPNTTFLMVSSEAKSFREYGKLLAPKYFDLKNIVVADKLNRRRIIRALVWYLATNDYKDYNLKPIFNIISYGEVEGTRRDIYEFFFGKDYPYSELTINLRSEKEFYKAFLKEIKNADPKYTKELKNSFDYVVKFLPMPKSRTTIVDLGWGGTVQALFSDFVRCMGIKAKIDGLYLGAHPADRFAIDKIELRGYLMPNVRIGEDRSIWNAVLWEYAFTNKVQFNEDFTHIENLHRGIIDGLSIFKSSHMAPFDYYRLVCKPQIRHYISNPSRDTVKVLGNIQFDAGFVDYHCFRIVNFNLSMFGIRKRLLFDTKNLLKYEIFGQNHWAAGYISYYRLYILKIALKIIGKIRHKYYI
jgi:hypothetical protein